LRDVVVVVVVVVVKIDLELELELYEYTSFERWPVSRAKKSRHCYCLLRVSYGVM